MLIRLAENNSVSFGEGVEREVIYFVFLGFVGEKNKLKWLVEQTDNFHTLCIQIAAHSRRFVCVKRRLALETFGAICALMMIHGLTPEPLDPCIFQFIIHGQDLHSLHEGFVGEWHPELRMLIRDWKEAGPQGDIQFMQSNLGSYNNMAVRLCSVLLSRWSTELEFH